jgi:hypothetical protein
MYTIMSTLAAVLILFSATCAHAGPFCDQFHTAPLEKQDTYILFIIDNLLKNWPQHDEVKQATTNSERLGMFTDARKKILSECAEGKDFAAGVALGEDLAIYKMSLLGGVSGE